MSWSGLQVSWSGLQVSWSVLVWTPGGLQEASGRWRCYGWARFRWTRSPYWDIRRKNFFGLWFLSWSALVWPPGGLQVNNLLSFSMGDLFNHFQVRQIVKSGK